MRFEEVSYNFSIAKVLAILIIATGHYFGGILSIFATVGLFIFAFSSGYFTASKYRRPFSKKEFWHAKIVRLLYPIVVIDIFLFFLFLMQGRTGIYAWQTLPSLLGLNGLLNWLSISNPSPFGVGMWFFTLLLLFYAFYPLIALINEKRIFAAAFLLVSLISTTILQYTMPVGYMLWMCSFAFIFGTYSGVYAFNLRPAYAVAIFLGSFSLMLCQKLILNFNATNYVLILIGSIAIVEYLLNKKLPGLYLDKIIVLSGSIMQIYFIHTYLFVKPMANWPMVNYIISMTIIIAVAFALSKISERLKELGTRLF